MNNKDTEDLHKGAKRSKDTQGGSEMNNKDTDFLDNGGKRAKDTPARAKAELQGPCAPIAKKLKLKNQELNKKKSELAKLRFELAELRPATFPVKILIVRGSIYDYTKDSLSMFHRSLKLKRLMDRLAAAKDILNKLGVNVKFSTKHEFIKEKKQLSRGDLRRIGATYGNPCKPVLVCTTKFIPSQSGVRGDHGYAIQGSNVACITGTLYSSFSLMSRSTVIAHNIIHLLGKGDNKKDRRKGNINHIANRIHPGTWATEKEIGLGGVITRGFNARVAACVIYQAALKNKEEEVKKAVKKLEEEIDKLDKKLKDCFKKKNLPERSARR